MRSIVHVDSCNLYYYYGALEGGPQRWLDLDRYFGLLRTARTKTTASRRSESGLNLLAHTRQLLPKPRKDGRLQEERVRHVHPLGGFGRVLGRKVPVPNQVQHELEAPEDGHPDRLTCPA